MHHVGSHTRLMVSLAILAVCLFSGPGLPWAPGVLALERVTVSYPGPSPFFLPAEIARQRGFFREQNLDVKLLLTKSEIDRTALASGDIDYTLRGGSTVLSAARGLPVRMLFVGATRPFWALVVRPEMNAVKDLKGKVLGVAGMLGSEHVTTKVILKQHGLDPDKDVVYTVVQIGARLPAMLSGAMGGGLMDYGEAFRARKAGFKILLNAADYYSILSSAVGVNLKKLREQPDQVKRFLKGNVQGIKYIWANREGTQEVMMNWMKVDREMAEGIYQLSLNNYTKDGSVDEATLKLMVDRQLAEANIKDVPLSKVSDFTLLNQVLREGQ